MVVLIGVTGPSSSGKSTVCKALESDSIGYVPMDYFFKTKEEHPSLNWDVPESIKFDDFYKTLIEIKKGNKVVIPKRSRKVGKIVGEVEVAPKTVFLIDGFMTLYDERIRKMLDLKLFIKVPREIQLERRKKRYNESGMEFDVNYFNNHVYPGYEKYIEPTMKYADLVIDGNKPLEENIKEIRHIIGFALKSRGIRI